MLAGKKIKNIYLGIAAERDYDIDVCVWLCRSILKPLELKVKLRKENRFVNTTKISPDHISNIKKFFEQKKQKRPKLIIIITDRDRNKKTKANLEEAVKKSGLFKPPVLVVTPIEHIERWLIEDPLAVNKVLNSLRSFQKVRDTIDDAKNVLEERIKKAISEGYFNGDPKWARIAIAKETRIDQLQINDFTEFKANLVREVKEIINPQKPLKITRYRKKRRRHRSWRKRKR